MMDTVKHNAVAVLDELDGLQGHWSGKGQEVKFDTEEHIPLEIGRHLGAGGVGRVSKVTWTNPITKKAICFARKSVLPNKAWPKDAVRNEITLLKKLKHHHIVSFVGSYESQDLFHILLLPCAAWDLSGLLNFLEDAGDSSPKEQFKELGWFTVGNPVYDSSSNECVQSHLKKMLGCIVSALRYLHESRVRHKDIKPSNILLDASSVYLTDFNISSTFAEGDISRTSGRYDSGTEIYSAPEVLIGDPRGRMAEIFSLGLVFMEVFTYLNGYSRSEMVSMIGSSDHVRSWKAKGLTGVRWYAAARSAWVTKIFPPTITNGRSGLPIRDLISDMLREHPEERPQAYEIASRLAEIDIDGALHGKCCWSDKSDVGFKSLLRNYDRLNEKFDQLNYDNESLTATVKELSEKNTRLELELESLRADGIPRASTPSASRNAWHPVQSPPQREATKTQSLVSAPEQHATSSKGRSIVTPSPETRAKKVYRNRNLQRLDYEAIQLSKNWTEKKKALYYHVKDMGLCRYDFLAPRGCYNEGCKFLHKYDEVTPTDHELIMLKYVTRNQPCTKGSGCDDENCLFGHHCLSKDFPCEFMQKERVCQFSRSQHLKDFEIATLVAV